MQHLLDKAYHRLAREGAIRPRRFSRLAAYARAVRRRHIGPLEYRRMRPTFIVGGQRTGTTVLRETLNTHPDIVLLGELFTRGSHAEAFETYVAARGLQRPAHYAEAESQLWDYLRHLRAQAPESVKVFGFDIKYSQLRTLSPAYEPLSAVPALIQFFHASQAQIVHVVRENVVQAALSELVAAGRDVWHHRQDEAIGQKVEVDGELLLTLIRQRLLDREIFGALMEDYPHLTTIDYEEIARGVATADEAGWLAGDSNAVVGLAGFLGVTGRLRQLGSMSKIVQAPYREIVTNYDEVVRKLRGSAFATWLDTI